VITESVRNLLLAAAKLLDDLKYDDTTAEQQRLFRFAASNIREACMALYMIEEDLRKMGRKAS
jgi:hypothetical protein